MLLPTSTIEVIATTTRRSLPLYGKLPYHPRIAVSKEPPERLEARVTKQQKALLKRAAAIRGRTLTDFVVSAAEEAAEQVIQSEYVIMLGADESVEFAEALLNPPEPNRTLRTAAERYLRR